MKTGELIKCEKCGRMRKCTPYNGIGRYGTRNLCFLCTAKVDCITELRYYSCGTNHEDEVSFWMQNQNDNVIKILEGE